MCVSIFMPVAYSNVATLSLVRRIQIYTCRGLFGPNRNQRCISWHESTHQCLNIIRWTYSMSIPWSLHSGCSSQNTTFCLAPPHKHQYLQLPKTIHADMFFFQQGIKGEDHCLLHHIPYTLLYTLKNILYPVLHFVIGFIISTPYCPRLLSPFS
jgi:hypothetical protein